MALNKWDLRYLRLARFWAAQCSKDPSTKVGAVLVSADDKREYLGYNGFPRGVNDDPVRYADRELKYKLVVHAEINAVLKAGKDAVGANLYVYPLFSCSECAKIVIQAGIARIVAPRPAEERWQSSYDTALMLYKEAHVEVEFYEGDLDD